MRHDPDEQPFRADERHGREFPTRGHFPQTGDAASARAATRLNEWRSSPRSASREELSASA